ncbi:hypothetical protein F5Y10DRAFT_173207 [Nemania abortiva]|nr:hypothetical protein F5Y10DRAFT_173207 [Nemania abortiva]
MASPPNTPSSSSSLKRRTPLATRLAPVILSILTIAHQASLPPRPRPPDFPPSKMSSLSNAFSLTETEKHVVLGDVKTLILQTGAMITRAQQSESRHDFDEAYGRLKEAIQLASDPDACDVALAPLATCYLYEGHILIGLGRYKDAYRAYEKAARADTHSLTDVPAVKDAARRMLDLRDKAEIASRAVVREHQRQDQEAARRRARTARPGEEPAQSFPLVGHSGAVLPATLHRGAERKLKDGKADKAEKS